MNLDDDQPERELEGLQAQADSLGDQITGAREDWEQKKADPAVPGADGDPIAAHSDHPDENFPAVGDADGENPLDASEQLDPQDPANEDL